MTVSFQTLHAGEDTVLQVSGEVDLDNRDELRTMISELVEAGVRRLVVDLTEVSFIDSSGLGALLGGRSSLVEVGGWMRLVISNPHVMKVFTITNLTEVFEIHSTRDQALVGPPSSA